MVQSSTGHRVSSLPELGRSWRALLLVRVPAWLFDLIAATSAMLVATIARIAIEQVVGGVVPFALTFPAVLAATLWAGPRAGIFAAIGCQALNVQYVLPNWLEGHGGDQAGIANLALVTASLAVVVWAASSYRRLSKQLRQKCEREVETLSLFVREMDHRTKNNFQIAAYLLSDQARGTKQEVASELNRASARLHSIASVYRNLVLVSDTAPSVDLDTYLNDVVSLLREGIVPDGVELAIRSDRIAITSHAAMIVGLLVNEWIVNAVKYAFQDAKGSISVDVERYGCALVVTVSDDGSGGADSTTSGVGSRLMNGLASTIDGTVSISREGGTTCVLRVQDASALFV